MIHAFTRNENLHRHSRQAGALTGLLSLAAREAQYLLLV